jgi:hypothetical protein
VPRRSNGVETPEAQVAFQFVSSAITSRGGLARISTTLSLVTGTDTGRQGGAGGRMGLAVSVIVPKGK